MTPVPTITPIVVASVVEGAYIELHARPKAWTVVQWQDGLGAWHIVEGWQGSADEVGEARWWVSSTQFGLGPFRWAIYDKPGGALVVTSRTFALPKVVRQRVQITVGGAP